VPAVADQLECTRKEAIKRVGISERQLRAWEQCGLIDPGASYGIDRLIALRTLAKLRAARVPTKKIQRAVMAVRKRLREVRDPFTELRIYSDGARIRVEVGGVRMDPENGQLLLDLEGRELQRLLKLPSPEAERLSAAAQKKQREAETWFQKGLDLEHAGAPVEQVLEAYRMAATLDPGMAPALVNLGTIFFTMRSFDQADKYYTRALEANPDYALAHFNLANLYDERGDRDRALAHYRRALELEPDYSDAHYNLALLYQTSGQVMKAVQHWRTYLKLDPAGSWAEIARRELEKLYATTVVRGERGKAAPGASGD
jgi:tetratricopeptide (TPR) repeat protein